MVKTLKKPFKSFLFLFLFFLKVSKGYNYNDWMLKRNNKAYCPNKILSCTFIISYNNPYTPLISSSFLNNAFSGPYRYIYFSFGNPKNKQKNFYLEATDTKRENINLITNGDCYLIDLNTNYYYELRIYKPLLVDSFILVKFINLNPGFIVEVSASFSLDMDIYRYGTKLTYENSLWKSNINELIKYEEEINKQIIEQKERKIKAFTKANEILFNLFGKTLSYDLEYTNTIFSTTIPVSYFLLVTISIATGLKVSTDNILEPEKDEIILNKFIGGIELESELDNPDYFKLPEENLELSNFFYNLVKIYRKKATGLILKLGLENDYVSTTISVSPTNKYISLIIRYFNPETFTNFFELLYKIEFTNKMFIDLTIANHNILFEALKYIDEIKNEYGFFLSYVKIFAIVIGIILLCIISILAPEALAYFGSFSAAALTIIHGYEVPLPLY